jgi:hypothetical protein
MKKKNKKVCPDCKRERKEYGVMWCEKHYDEKKDIERQNYKKSFDWHKFWKLFLIKLANKILELAVLFGIGYALGLKLIRY